MLISISYLEFIVALRAIPVHGSSQAKSDLPTLRPFTLLECPYSGSYLFGHLSSLRVQLKFHLLRDVFPYQTFQSDHLFLLHNLVYIYLSIFLLCFCLVIAVGFSSVSSNLPHTFCFPVYYLPSHNAINPVRPRPLLSYLLLHQYLPSLAPACSKYTHTSAINRYFFYSSHDLLFKSLRTGCAHSPSLFRKGDTAWTAWNWPAAKVWGGPFMLRLVSLCGCLGRAPLCKSLHFSWKPFS